MKKLFILLVAMASFAIATAQNYEILYVEMIENGSSLSFCESIDGVLIYGQEGCEFNQFTINWQTVVYDSVLLTEKTHYYIEFEGCDWFHRAISITFASSNVPNPFPEPFVWKRTGEAIELYALGNVAEPGTYSVTISNACGDYTFPIEVRDNVELYRASVDLETNLNKVTWQTDESQAEYISQVKVYRDGFFVGTAPYENGYFLDAIGSDNAARNYQIVGVTPEGEDCPIASHQKGTIHTTYYLDVNDNLNMTWNIPYVEQGAQGSLTYFQVCKYDPNTEQLTVVDQVNSLITDYTCGVNQFAGGYPVIAAVFSNSKDREFEDMSFSNMYTDIAIQPQEITITLTPGWNWISYPYAVSKGIDEALGDFIPVEGDIIKSRLVSSSYTNGRWRGGVNHFTPGWGYMYYSSRNEPATLVFDLSSFR